MRPNLCSIELGDIRKDGDMEGENVRLERKVDNWGCHPEFSLNFFFQGKSPFHLNIHDHWGLCSAAIRLNPFFLTLPRLKIIAGGNEKKCHIEHSMNVSPCNLMLHFSITWWWCTNKCYQGGKIDKLQSSLFLIFAPSHAEHVTWHSCELNHPKNQSAWTQFHRLHRRQLL